MATRVFSFAAGSCPLPPRVKEQIARDVIDWEGRGISALEIPFTSAEFEAVLTAAKNDLRLLLGIPRSYEVLFLQGGATAQFGMLPLNLRGSASHCEYVESGYWSRRAIAEAQGGCSGGGNGACHVRVVATGTATRPPSPGTWRHKRGAAYCHFTSNESANGLQFRDFPDGGEGPLVVDMTGDFLTRPVPVKRFGLIYASAQKSLGATGLTIVIVRADLLDRARADIPVPFNFALQAAARSKVNTPPTLAIIVAARMLRWLVESGGLQFASARAEERSTKLYAAIDGSGFYRSPVACDARSAVNVCFHLPNERLEEAFAREAEARGLLHLRGHVRVGGLRASIFNGTPDEAIEALLAFMGEFRARNS